jgi:LmbE family N-acetylglucosaminyl deacetylase
MKFHNSNARFFVPDQIPAPEALARTTHLGIGAHQDDLEFFAYHGIEACYGRPDRWFTGVTCTDGAGSSRVGPYESFTDKQMAAVRVGEQDKAAVVGDYAAMIQLGYPSKAIKEAGNSSPVDDLESILAAAHPEVLYLHNPADKHDTHIAVLLRALTAVHRLPPGERPGQTWGCEIWRSLDWLLDEDKGILPTSGRPNLQAALNGVFDSQIMGGKRYDLAVMGRRLANATFFESHASDTESGLTFAMDLSPLVQDETIDLVDYTLSFVERLKSDIAARISRFS